MGEFFEKGDGVLSPPSVFTQSFLEDVVKKSIENGDVKKDAKLIFIAGADSDGVKAIASVSLIPENDKFQMKLNAIFEHDWDGDNRVGAKVVFSM